MGNNEQIDIDSISRSRIISETSTNFFVEAGAGSGKTTMLVNRMVSMVEQGKDISKICAITFTKAAAGEFYERFQKILIERSNPNYSYVNHGYAGELPAPTDETRALCAKALENIDLCFMGTIDSFCNMVLSEHPSEAGIPSDATLMSDADAERFYKIAFVEICRGDYGIDLSDMAKSFATLYRNAEDVFVFSIKEIMDHRNVHFNFTPMSNIDAETEFKPIKKELVDAIEKLLAHEEIAYTNNKGSAEAWLNLSDAYKDIKKNWNINIGNVYWALKKIDGLRTLKPVDEIGLSNGAVFEDHETRGKYGWTDLLVSPIKDKIDDFRYRVSMTFLLEAAKVLEKVTKEKGILTYFDYLLYLRDTLLKDAMAEGRLIEYIYNRHSFF